MPRQLRGVPLPELPAGKKIEDLFADFYHYLFTCASQFIQETHPYLRASWSDLCLSAKFILTHPNSWDGKQQDLMRKAAVKAGLVPDTPQGKSRIIFVAEGEASLHYCVRGGFIDDVCFQFSIFSYY